MGKLGYLVSSALRSLSPPRNVCPDCGAVGEVVDRKWLVTSFRRCVGCSLLFRAPTTAMSESVAFYQEDYEQGFTTEVPQPMRLAELLATGFVGEDKHYAGYIAVLKALGIKPGARLFDYGCSWGYGSWQLARAGYEVEAYEISKPRANYAHQHLGVNLCERPEERVGQFDVFFSAHVAEHVPSLQAMLELGTRLLKPGGLMVCFTPNGSMVFRAADPVNWHLMWGMAHPQLVDEVYLFKRFAGRSLLLTSAPLHDLARGHPLDLIQSWDSNSTEPVCGRLDHVELLFVSRRVP